jgi:hypothetical protein
MGTTLREAECVRPPESIRELLLAGSVMKEKILLKQLVRLVGILRHDKKPGILSRVFEKSS